MNLCYGFAGRSACCPASGIHVVESIKLIAAATGGGASSARARRLSRAVLAGATGTGGFGRLEPKQPEHEIRQRVSLYVSAGELPGPAGNPRSVVATGIDAAGQRKRPRRTVQS